MHLKTLRLDIHHIPAIILFVTLALILSGCPLLGEDLSEPQEDDSPSLNIPVSVSANVGAVSGGASSVTAQVYDLSPFMNRDYYKEPLRTLDASQRVATITPDTFILQMDFLRLYHRPENAASGMDFVTDDLRSQFADEAGAIIPQMVNMRYADRFIRGVSASREQYHGIAMQFLVDIGQSNGMPTTSYFAVDISGIEGATCDSFRNPRPGAGESDILLDYSEQLERDFGITSDPNICYFSFSQLQPLDVDFLSYIIIGSDIDQLAIQNPEGAMPPEVEGEPYPSWQFPGGGTSGNASQLFVPASNSIDFRGLTNPEVVFDWDVEDLVEIYRVENEGEEEDHFYITLNLTTPFPISLTVREQSEGSGGSSESGAADEVMRPYIGVAQASEFGTSIHNTIYWINPPDPAFDKVVIVRKEDSAPVSPDDGEVVHDSHLPAFVDATGEQGIHYYYRVYTVSHDGTYSNGVVVDRVQGPRS